MLYLIAATFLLPIAASADTNPAFVDKVLQNKLAFTSCQCSGKVNGRKVKAVGPCKPFDGNEREAAFVSEPGYYKMATNWGSISILKTDPNNYTHKFSNQLLSPADGKNSGYREHVTEVGVADENAIQHKYFSRYQQSGKVAGVSESSVEIRRVDDDHVKLTYTNRETDGVNEKTSDAETCDAQVVPRDDMSRKGAVRYPELNARVRHDDPDATPDELMENSAE